MTSVTTASPPDQASPKAEYLRMRSAREESLAVDARRDLAISRARTAVVLAAMAIAVLSFGAHLLSPWLLGAPTFIFVALMVTHERVLRAKRLAERAVDFYDAGLRRLEGRWYGRGVTRIDFAPRDHPYAADLDLFGRGSLFDLLCTARSRRGQEVLASWLLAPADVATISERQTAIRELRDRIDFREQLALVVAETSVEAVALETWGEAPLQLGQSWLPPVALVLGIAGVCSLAAWWPLHFGPLPLVAVIAVGQLFLAHISKRLKSALHGVEESAVALSGLSALMELLERERGEAPMLRDLRSALASDGAPPSSQIRRLVNLLDWMRIRENMLLAPFARVALWSVQFTFAIESWRRANGSKLREWLRVAAEYEALAALAGYAYEHPEDPFPELVESGAAFTADGIGHPLLSRVDTVFNDVRFADPVELYVVSGSNMSGKSTLLRSVGMNTVLALAGAPVRARRLVLSPVQIGASIRTEDSLQGGVSRFYAEILRLRQVVGLTGESRPVLFLLDEILHGTNSHDRLIGAEAIARSLVKAGAIGLITTHDLALARLADDPALHAVNVHFEDQLVNGTMSFDYTLRAGVVEKSNALELMRAIGLDV